MAEQKPQKDTSSMVSLVWDLGFIFAVPLVVFAVVGRILDNRLHTSPGFLLVGIIGAAIASSVGVFFKVRKLMAPITGTSEEKQKDIQK